MVRLQNGDRWICQNADCRCEIVVVKSSGLKTGSNPICSCGSTMKKPYTTPELKELRPDEAEDLFPEQRAFSEMRVSRAKQTKR
jgi:hypothetical protein